MTGQAPNRTRRSDRKAGLAFLAATLYLLGAPLATSAELITNVYVVPPKFLESAPISPEGEIDPFAPTGDRKSGDPGRSRTARSVLESYGITFSEGTSAVFNPQNSQLIVRQTADQMDLVEAVVESLLAPPESQVHLVYQLIETEAPLFPRKPSPPPLPSVVDPDSGARGTGSPARGRPSSPLPHLVALDPSEVEALVTRIQEEKLGKVRLAPAFLARSGRRVQVWVGDSLTEVDPVIAAGGLTVDLNLRLLDGRIEDLENLHPKGSGQVSLLSGHSVAMEEPREGGGYRTRLLTVTLVDPAGFPVTEPPTPRRELRTYLVPPTFLSLGDSSASPSSAQDILEAAGIPFDGSASASFLPNTSQLVVRHTPKVLEQVDAFVERITRDRPRKQIHFAIKEVILEANRTDPLGFLLPPSPQGKANALPPVTPPPGSLAKPGIAGVFTDPQFQVVIRALHQDKGASLLSAPSIVTRSGQPGLVELDERRWGIRGTVGADEFTIDIELFLPEPGEAWTENGRVVADPDAALTIWDGQTIAYSQPIDGGKKNRLTFVTGRMIEPTGAPVRPTEVDLPEKGPGSHDLAEAQQQAVALADEAALRAARLKRDGDLVEAERQFIESLRLLPVHPLTEARRKAYLDQLLSTWEALQHEGGLSRENPEVPSLFPASSPAAELPEGSFVVRADERLVVHFIEKGDTLFRIARHFGTSVPRIKTVNRMTSDVLQVGTPIIVPSHRPEAAALPTWSKPRRLAGAEKAAALIIPELEFRDTPLIQAIQVLQRASVEADRDSPDPEKGLNFVLHDAEDLGHVRITLKLRQVPLAEAVRYTAELSGCHYRIEGDTITLSRPAEAGRAKAGDDDPAELWFRAYLEFQEGVAAEREKRPVEALHAFRQARERFAALAKRYPEFQPALVRERLRLLEEKLESTRPGRKKSDRPKKPPKRP